VSVLTKLLMALMLVTSLPMATAMAEEAAEGEEAAPPEDPELNDRTSLLPQMTFTVLLPTGKRHIMVTAWLQMKNVAWVNRANQLHSRINDAIINDLYKHFYAKGVKEAAEKRNPKPAAPAKPVEVPTYGGGKGAHDDKIAAFLAREAAGASPEARENEKIKAIIKRAATKALGKDRILEVTLKQVIESDR
jgi:hypothetical protein